MLLMVPVAVASYRLRGALNKVAVHRWKMHGPPLLLTILSDKKQHCTSIFIDLSKGI